MESLEHVIIDAPTTITKGRVHKHAGLEAAVRGVGYYLR